CAPLDATS
ncbi:hypothetical protein CFC21_056749, partial [Triticum aestivum]